MNELREREQIYSGISEMAFAMESKFDNFGKRKNIVFHAEKSFVSYFHRHCLNKSISSSVNFAYYSYTEKYCAGNIPIDPERK